MTNSFETAKAAISSVHSDTTIQLEQNLDLLEQLRDHTQELIEAIEADIEMSQE